MTSDTTNHEDTTKLTKNSSSQDTTNLRIEYEGKRSVTEILTSVPVGKLAVVEGKDDASSMLIHGPNSVVMRTLLESYGLKGKIDLIYIDPPYSTNSVFTFTSDRASTISRVRGGSIAYDDSLTGAEYLEFIRERLLLLNEFLSDEGSIYVHVDYKVGHYVKVVMDEIFGEQNYLSDIARIKCNPKNFRRNSYGNIKDMILFYTKSGKHIWNSPRIDMPEDDVKRLFKKVDDSGRRYTTVPLHAPGETENGSTGKPWKGMSPPPGRHWRCSPAELDLLEHKGLIEWSKNGVPRKKIFAEKSMSKLAQDILNFKDPQKPSYPTEKNIDLLKFLIGASSNEDSIVMDCFCGSGTTLRAAKALGRRWVGIDASEEAIRVASKHLKEEQKTITRAGEHALYRLLDV